MAERWLLLNEAVPASGYSLATLRRYIKAGKCQSRKVPSSSGPKWEVEINSLPPLLERVGGQVEPPPAAESTLEPAPLVLPEQPEQALQLAVSQPVDVLQWLKATLEENAELKVRLARLEALHPEVVEPPKRSWWRRLWSDW